MRLPSIRNPKGFGDLFLILIVYVALTGIIIQYFDSTIIRRIYTLGSLLVLAWACWAVYSMLGSSEEEDENL